ncbi:TIGR03663 family protein, partial [bacterium]|nr:TIGR03663 family protein [bacterium]
GVLLILFPLKRWLNWSGLLSAMALAAISPTAVYYSRDNIHEMYLMFFTAGTFVCGYLFIATMKNKYLYLSAALLALMFATKETTMVTLVIWCISAIGSSIFTTKPTLDIFKRFGTSIKESFNIYKKPLFILFFAVSIITIGLVFFSDSFKQIETRWYIALLTKGITMMTFFFAFTMFFQNLRAKFKTLLISWVIFFAVLSFFFSSYFSYGDGVGKFFQAFEMWTHQGTVGSLHTKPFGYYLKILYRFEKPILILGLGGIIFSFWKRKPIDLFTAFFAIGSFLAFSIIPYKTPWCVQNIMLPLFILSGLFFKYLFELTSSFILRSAYVPLFLIVLFSSLSLSADVNYLSYDNNSYEIVYVQTLRSAKDLAKRIEELSNVKFQGRETKILMASPDNLPLNWYLRKTSNYWFQKVVEDADNYPIIIARRDQEGEIESKMKKKYQKEQYSLRPGIGLTLYYQGDDQVRIIPEKFNLTDTIDLSEKSSLLKPGLLGEVYGHVNFSGKKLGERIDEKIDFRYDTDLEKPYPAPFCIVWNGYLKVPESGDYIISSISDDGSFVFIDGKQIVDNGGEHGEQRRSRDVFLGKGYHEIQVKYFDLMGGAIMRLYWKQPGRLGEKPLTGEYLFHLD